MSYDPSKVAVTPPLAMGEVKDLLELAPTSFLVKQEIFPEIVQTLFANKHINYTDLRDTFGPKTKKRDFEEGKGVDPQTARTLIDHFRALPISAKKPEEAEADQAAEDIRSGNIPPSQPEQCARLEAEQVLRDLRRTEVAHPRNSLS